MDVFAHMLWTNVVYFKKYQNQLKDRLWAVFFGVVPDLVGFTPAFFYMIFSGQFGPKAFNNSVWVFKFASESYNYTHSIVVFLVVALIVYIIRRGRVYWPMFGWALHILIDIPTHKIFYETPFLFPLSNYKFGGGVSWGHPVFMLVNYSAIILVYLGIYFIWRKKNATK